MLAQSISLKYEHISVACLSAGSEWLHIGTEKGNVLFFNSTNFVRSSYDVMWNKACCGDYKQRPGPVTIISPHPVDASKLLLGFESGLLILWDYMEKAPVVRYDTQRTGEILCSAWAPNGLTFVTGHGDGMLRTWKEKERKHIVADEDDLAVQLCEPITWVSYFHDGSKPMILHNGGPTPLDPAIHYFSIIHGTDRTKLELPDAVNSVVCTTPDPWGKGLPATVIMLTGRHLDVYTTQHQPTLDATAATEAARVPPPHGLEVQHSDICCTALFKKCPRGLVSALKGAGVNAATAAGARWAPSGGTPALQVGMALQHTLVMTGHSDGAVCFWVQEDGLLTLIYTLPPPPLTGFDQKTAAIHVDLCCDAQQLAVAYTNGAVVLFTFAVSRATVRFSRVQGVLPIASAQPAGSKGKKEITSAMVTQVASYGFTEDAAMEALVETNGDINLATMQLFNKDLGTPKPG